MERLSIVRLRPLAEADLPVLHRWYQTPSLWDHLVGEFEAREEAQAIAYMRAWLAPSRSELRLAVERAENGDLIGLVALSPIDEEAGEAEFHILLGEEAERGRGYGRAATAAMLAHAFDERGLWRVRLRVLQTNAAALRIYAEVGFAPEEAEPAAAVKGGVATPVIALCVTDAVFQARLGAQAPRSAMT